MAGGRLTAAGVKRIDEEIARVHGLAEQRIVLAIHQSNQPNQSGAPITAVAHGILSLSYRLEALRLELRRNA